MISNCIILKVFSIQILHNYFLWPFHLKNFVKHDLEEEIVSLKKKKKVFFVFRLQARNQGKSTDPFPSQWKSPLGVVDIFLTLHYSRATYNAICPEVTGMSSDVTSSDAKRIKTGNTPGLLCYWWTSILVLSTEKTYRYMS